MPDGTHEFEPVVKVVASAVSITVGLANDRQMTFQSGFEGDEPDDVVNARFDRIMHLADRQKARYEIPEIEDELHKQRETLANFQEDLDRVEINHTEAQAQRQVQIDTLRLDCGRAIEEAKAATDVEILKVQELKTSVTAEGVAEHNRAGKLGSYVPKGHVKANLDRCEKALDTLAKERDTHVERLTAEYDAQVMAVEREIERAEAERNQHIANLNISINRYKDAISHNEDRLAKRRATAEG